ncbi:MAG: serine/threonine protein kinase [Labilithrix sp.]|nr:serine/threonine protein kinase [Labilithrix sp.]
MSARDVFNLCGRTIADKFRVERVLGEGGFGVVYAGTHLVLNVPIAIKCLKPFGSTPQAQAEGAEGFLREARILFGLGHPAIVRLYDAGVVPEGQIPYAVLELLSGMPLDGEIATRAKAFRHFTRDEIVGVFGPILEAVAFAHERGICHRDLKPANMMLVVESGRVAPKVLDFGTARADAYGQDVRSGKTGFTPLYGAPEQWDAAYGTTGPRTDVFALGMTIAEACLLEYPLAGATAGILSVFRSVLDDGARLGIAAKRPDLPPELERVLFRAMRPRADDRFADARELSSAFRTALRVAPSTAPLAMPLFPSNMPPAPPVPALTPPPPAPIFSQTTQPHALTARTRSGANMIGYLVGAIGLFVAAVGLAIGAIVVVKRAKTAPPEAPAIAETDDPPPIPIASSSAGGRAVSGQIIVAGVIGTQPFWSQGEIMDVARKRQPELQRCLREGLALDPAMSGNVSLTVHPEKTGVMGSAQCSFRPKSRGEPALCGCIEAAVGKWRFPPARGRLGLLESGAFIYDFKVVQ